MQIIIYYEISVAWPTSRRVGVYVKSICSLVINRNSFSQCWHFYCICISSVTSILSWKSLLTTPSRAFLLPWQDNCWLTLLEKNINFVSVLRRILHCHVNFLVIHANLQFPYNILDNILELCDFSTEITYRSDSPNEWTFLICDSSKSMKKYDLHQLNDFFNELISVYIYRIENSAKSAMISSK